MKKVKLKSQISGKSIDELFDYQTQDKINQTFTIDSNRTFYKNNNYLESKQLDLNETVNPILLGNEFLFSIEKIQNNNDQRYFFVSKSNFPSLKLSYHNYRLNTNKKERESPTWISLYNFNYEINEIQEKYNLEQRRKKNKNFFLKNKKNCYELNVGDVIKLGRVSLIMTKIHLQKYKKNSNNSNNLNVGNNKKNNTDKDNGINNRVIKDIYKEYHFKALKNKIKINLDKKMLKKLNTNTNNDLSINNNSNNNQSINIAKESILLNEENEKNDKIDKIDKNKRYSAINEENLTSKVKIDYDLNNTYLNKTCSFIELKEKSSFKEINEKEKENNKKSNSEKENVCRICYCDEEELKSPLVNLCNCSGDVKYIHLSCLSHWLETKSKILNLSNDLCKHIFFNKIHCEICKEKYPEIVFDVIKKKTYQVYNPEEIFSFLNNIYNNYIVFESFELINQKKLIYIISFDEKNSISIGRGQDCDVRLGDVTVSRTHSLLLRTKENKIMIKDAGSKFGTLILLQAKKVLISNKILSIQIGKLYLNLCVQYFNLNCLCNFFYYCFCCFCFKKNKKGKNEKNEKKSNFSYSNRFKNDYLNESHFNMINNYMNSNIMNILDYNLINLKSIMIEDVMDVKFQIDENNLNNNLDSNINHLYKYINEEKEKNDKLINESFNNLNNIA